jgi:hypothetical protein
VVLRRITGVKGEVKEAGANLIMRSFIIYSLDNILLW